MSDFLAFVSHAIRRGLWAPMLILLVDSALDLGFDIYTKFPSFDIVSHFLGGVAIAYLIAVAYRGPNAKEYLGAHSKISFFIFTLCATAAVCVAWEFAEWLSDYCFNSHTQLGLDDTMGDFFFGLLGAAVFGIFSSRAVE